MHVLRVEGGRGLFVGQHDDEGDEEEEGTGAGGNGFADYGTRGGLLRVVVDAASGVLAPDVSACFVDYEADEGDAIANELERADVGSVGDDVEDDEEDVFEDSAEGVGYAGGFANLQIVSIPQFL